MGLGEYSESHPNPVSSQTPQAGFSRAQSAKIPSTSLAVSTQRFL